jgi:hypothetical protein
MMSVPGAVATASQQSAPLEIAGSDPVATAPGTDIIASIDHNCPIISAGFQYAQRF